MCPCVWLKCHCDEKIFDPILNTTEYQFLDILFRFGDIKVFLNMQIRCFWRYLVTNNKLHLWNEYLCK